MFANTGNIKAKLRIVAETKAKFLGVGFMSEYNQNGLINLERTPESGAKKERGRVFVLVTLKTEGDYLNFPIGIEKLEIRDASKL